MLEVLHVERLGEDRARPKLQGGRRDLRRAERGHHDDRGCGRDASDFLEETQITGIRKPQIQENHVGCGHVSKCPERRRPVLRFGNAKTGSAKRFGNAPANQRLIIYNKDLLRQDRTTDAPNSSRFEPSTTPHGREAHVPLRCSEFREAAKYLTAVRQAARPPLYGAAHSCHPGCGIRFAKLGPGATHEG